MKSDFVKISGSVVSVGLLSLVLPFAASAAKINATLSHESGDYGSDYNYSGPRFDMTINPDGSNWYYSLGYRDREHESDQTYKRADVDIAYRFRFDGGWVQPSINLRKDTTMYNSGTRIVLEKYMAETKYLYSFNDSWGIWGEVQFSLDKQTSDKFNDSPDSNMQSNYLSWEIEPGVRYYFANSSRLTVSYYNVGQRSDKGDTWGLTDDKSSQQARIYYYWKMPFGLSFSPYIRLPLGYGDTSAWYDSASFDHTKTMSKTSRYALQLAYPLTDTFQLQAEYYIEDTEYKEGFNMGKEDGQAKYLKFGVRAAF
ncbi:MAG: hypothetical protein QNK26_15415 [Moritella sp.]|uniref:outer membrane beta-barrel protein n=1 Tax=Moritella sp. TaxID=78556 RepID=UPI0029BE114E|nr:outer membrane beta-barrel protein [Moritella sp.]MDX2321974.1 hypothetical protein [Moritella sp.]